MALTRWGWEGSDLYIYVSGAEGIDGIVCCGCPFQPYDDPWGSPSWNIDDEDGFLDHIDEHRSSGHCVPVTTDEIIDYMRDRT